MSIKKEEVVPRDAQCSKLLHRGLDECRQHKKLYLRDVKSAFRAVVQLGKKVPRLHCVLSWRGLKWALMCVVRAAHSVSRKSALCWKAKAVRLVKLERRVYPYQPENAQV